MVVSINHVLLVLVIRFVNQAFKMCFQGYQRVGIVIQTGRSPGIMSTYGIYLLFLFLLRSREPGGVFTKPWARWGCSWSHEPGGVHDEVMGYFQWFISCGKGGWGHAKLCLWWLRLGRRRTVYSDTDLFLIFFFGNRFGLGVHGGDTMTPVPMHNLLREIRPQRTTRWQDATGLLCVTVA